MAGSQHCHQRGACWEAAAGTGMVAAITALTWAGTAAAQAPPAPARSLPGTAQSAVAVTERILPLEVIVNGTKSGTWLLLERLGGLYAPREALEEWRLRVTADATTVTFKGTEYLPLAAIPGFAAKVNFGNQSVELTFSAQAFAATRLTTEVNKKPVLSPVMTSVFLNYDLNYNRTRAKEGAGTSDLGALGELGFSSGWGVLTSSYVGRNLAGSDSFGLPRGWLRLETTFTRDLPQRNQTLRLGDTSTRAGMWGRSVYFGGVQWGSNFALTPGFISQPLPILSGVSASPSTVELYVNDVLRQVSQVPTGPFAIDNYPALTGGGDARVVVRDLLGRETVITQPFFTSSQLLAAGLTDWSLEAGALRRDLGTANNRYRTGFGSGLWRRGLSNTMTLEARAEATRTSQNIGIGGLAGMPWQMLAKGALVAGRDRTLGNGHLWLLGVERQSLRTGAYLQVQRASSGYRQLGEEEVATPMKMQVAGNVTYTTDKLGTLGVGFASVSRYGAERITTLSGNYSMRIGQRSNLTVFASRAMNGASGNSIAVTLIVPLENNRLVSATAGSHGGRRDLYATATQTAPEGTGFGWRTLAGERQGEATAEGGLYYTGRYGSLTGELSAAERQSALRLGASGGLIMADGHLFPSRRLDDSFALAEVAGYGNVGIGLGSNVLTHTDSAGVALVPRLAAYQANSIRIDPKELPIDAEIDSIEQTVVPAWRSGVRAVFPVRSGRGALLRIVFDDGEPAPAGAVIKLEGDKQEFYVARRGEAFVTGLQPVNRAVLTWGGKQCRFDVKLPADSKGEIPRLGPLPCQGVER